MEKKLNYKINLRKVKLFVFDVDGVLTNGEVLLDAAGEMTRNSHVRDSLAIRLALQAGLKVIIISAGSSQKVKERYEYLGVKDVFMKAFTKYPILESYLEKHNIDVSEVLYMGDDMPDYECLLNVGVATCPRDAYFEVREICDYISTIDGGRGAVRDVVEQTMRVQGLWPDLKKNPRIEL
jgi:3-deoxy-D-manno-octulosonate 8-phosphate phosphatase (KDO 8-P phosphatase)